MDILSLITLLSITNHVDPKLMLAIAGVESSYNAKAEGANGEVGLFQLKPSTAKLERYTLYDPITNTLAAIKYLKQVQKECKYKNNFKYLVCYNQGISGGSKIKNPELHPYYLKVMKYYELQKRTTSNRSQLVQRNISRRSNNIVRKDCR